MQIQSAPNIKKFSINFFRCGLIGWCMECFWTGMGAIKSRSEDKRLLCHTSMWMFPIYGFAAIIPSVYQKIRQRPAYFRGGIYAFGIFFFEFITGSFLKKRNACPWDYSKAKYNYKGLIRFDYGPCWAIAGLFFERVLCKKQL